MALGASGFLDKGRLDPHLLERTIRYAMRQREVVRTLNRKALRDEATGLVSRPLFRDRLVQALAHARRRQSQVAVVLIEVKQEPDQPKIPAPCDEQLACLAKHLTHQLRATDTVARIADHHLALILEGLQEPDNAALVTQKVLDGLASSEPANGASAIPAPAAGIALYPEDGSDGNILLQRAANALLQAKADKIRRYRFSSDLMDRKAPRQFLCHRDLRHALDQNAIALRYRPLVHIGSSMISLSADIHLSSSDNEFVSAARFRSIADDRSLVKETTRETVRAAISHLQAWQKQGFGNIELSVPFISERASDLPFLQQALLEYLKGADIDPCHIEIDLNQALISGDLAAGGHGLSALKATGIRLAFDGFGRREISIHDLANDRLLDSLKLSSRLYRDLPGNASQATLLTSIIALGHDLDLRVVANGARDDRQFAFLKGAGCDAIKLRATGSTLTAEKFLYWLKQNKQSTSSSTPHKLGLRHKSKPTPNQVFPAAMDISLKGRLSSAKTPYTDLPQH